MGLVHHTRTPSASGPTTAKRLDAALDEAKGPRPDRGGHEARLKRVFLFKKKDGGRPADQRSINIPLLNQAGGVLGGSAARNFSNEIGRRRRNEQ